MAKAEFTKGQIVNVYMGDFYTCNVKVVQYVVASCGAKQMHLLRNDGTNAEWRCRAPFRGVRQYGDVQCATVDPVAHTLALRKLFATWTAEHFADRAERYGSDAGYMKSLNEARARFEAATADLV